MLVLDDLELGLRGHNRDRQKLFAQDLWRQRTLEWTSHRLEINRDGQLALYVPPALDLHHIGSYLADHGVHFLLHPGLLCLDLREEVVGHLRVLHSTQCIRRIQRRLTYSGLDSCVTHRPSSQLMLQLRQADGVRLELWQLLHVRRLLLVEPLTKQVSGSLFMLLFVVGFCNQVLVTLH